MADTLTAAQTLAVERPGGPILVAAAAGSGKTKVIVERLMSRVLCQDRDCSVNDFLIITFTKKAAAELRARIARELADRLALDPDNRHLQKQQSRVYMTQISTVHAFCADLLREFAYELNIPADFRILEQTEASALRERIVNELLEDRYASIADDPALRLLIDGLGAGRDDRQIPGLVLGVYETAQCNVDPARWLDEQEARLDLSGIAGAEQTVWGDYLLKGVRRCAMEQAAVLKAVKADLEQNASLAKYCPTFLQNVGDLRSLASHGTWDGMLNAMENLNFGKLHPVRNCDDPLLKDRAQETRKYAQKQIEKWKDEFYGPSGTVLADLAQTADTLRALFALTRDFTTRYDAEKRRVHGFDFGDLEHLALRLLLEADGETPTAAARRISERYAEIMVDEYQDTNEVQDAIFQAVSREGANRFLVGDVKQSIYRFRLADPEIFLKKYAAYPDADKADPAGPQRILLSHNFRSGEAVLEAVNAVFSRCMSPEIGGLDYGEAEALRPGRPMDPLPQTQVELHCLCTRQSGEDEESPDKNRAEAFYAARRIRELLDSKTCIRGPEGPRPAEPGDVVILLRSPKNTASFYLEALRRLGIPAASDTGESILDAAEVQALLCLLRVLDNAHQDIPFTGALLSPIFGVRAGVLAKVRSENRRAELWDAAAVSDDPTLSQAIEILSALREQSRVLPLHTLLEKVQQTTELEAVYGAMEGGTARIQNLRAFFQLAAAFSEGGTKSLHQLLDHVEELRAKGGVSVRRAASNAVTVMSIHKSKGLEFPVVLLCGLSRDFNQTDLEEPVQFHSRLGAGCAVYDRPTHARFSSIARTAVISQTRIENISEELRILYVAMTRARDMLIMTCCGHFLEGRLQKLALCLSSETSRLKAAQALCPGDWVLLAALLRTEAGVLHEIAGKPAGTAVSDWPWRIEWHDLPAQTAAVGAEEAVLPEEPIDVEALAGNLAFRYPHAAAQTVPSKLTATQLKGRNLDREADDGVPREDFVNLKLRKPSLLRTGRPLTPAQKGTAVHQAMQYLDFSQTADLEQIRAELERMTRDAFLTPEQAAAVDPEKLLRVFRGPLGDMIRSADRVLREFKFSILTPADRWYPEAEGEKVLLQGVTDCCLFQNGGITVVDFKTDRIVPGSEQEAGEKYKPQLEAYASALQRIFRLPVTKMYLYFFETDNLTEVISSRQ